jgi:hypothetical protein
VAAQQLRSISQLSAPVEALARDLRKALEQKRDDFDQELSDPKALLSLLARVASVTREITTAAREAIELERKILGEPEPSTVVNVLALKSDSPEESDHLDKLVARVLERRQARALPANGVPELPTTIVDTEGNEQ